MTHYFSLEIWSFTWILGHQTFLVSFDIPNTLDAIRRVQNIKMLGVTFTDSLSVAPHVQQLATSNAQVMYALEIPVSYRHLTLPTNREV